MPEARKKGCGAVSRSRTPPYRRAWFLRLGEDPRTSGFTPWKVLGGHSRLTDARTAIDCRTARMSEVGCCHIAKADDLKLGEKTRQISVVNIDYATLIVGIAFSMALCGLDI